MLTISSFSIRKILERRKRSQQPVAVPQFPSVPSVIFCKFLSSRPTAALARRAAQIPTHFCPRLDDKIATSVNSTPVFRSIAAGTSMRPRITKNTTRKSAEKCYSQNQYSLLFVSPHDSLALGLFDFSTLRCSHRRDKTTPFCRLSAIFQHSRQNSRSVFRRTNLLPCNPVAKTKRRSGAQMEFIPFPRRPRAQQRPPCNPFQN
jgi:hypothetical protein